MQRPAVAALILGWAAGAGCGGDDAATRFTPAPGPTPAAGAAPAPPAPDRPARRDPAPPARNIRMH